MATLIPPVAVEAERAVSAHSTVLLPPAALAEMRAPLTFKPLGFLQSPDRCWPPVVVQAAQESVAALAMAAPVAAVADRLAAVGVGARPAMTAASLVEEVAVTVVEAAVD